MSNSFWLHELQDATLPCPSLPLGVFSKSCLLSRRCHPTISSSVVPFSSCPQSFPGSEKLCINLYQYNHIPVLSFELGLYQSPKHHYDHEKVYQLYKLLEATISILFTPVPHMKVKGSTSTYLICCKKSLDLTLQSVCYVDVWINPSSKQFTI